jgi:hypothetical protein
MSDIFEWVESGRQMLFSTRHRIIASIILLLILYFFVANFLNTGSFIIPFWYKAEFKQKRMGHVGFIGAMRPNMFGSEQVNIDTYF